MCPLLRQVIAGKGGKGGLASAQAAMILESFCLLEGILLVSVDSSCSCKSQLNLHLPESNSCSSCDALPQALL